MEIFAAGFNQGLNPTTKTIKAIHYNSGPCLWCDQELNQHVQFEPGTTPDHGDMAICFACLGTMVYSEDLSFKKPSQATLTLLFLNDPFFVRAWALLQKFQEGWEKKHGKMPVVQKGN